MLAPLSAASAGRLSTAWDAVRIRQVPGPDYVSLFVENRRAYDVTVSLRIEAKNASVTRIQPETGVSTPPIRASRP